MVEKRVFNTRLGARSSWIHVKGKPMKLWCMYVRGDKWEMWVSVCSRSVILHLYF